MARRARLSRRTHGQHRGWRQPGLQTHCASRMRPTATADQRERRIVRDPGGARKRCHALLMDRSGWHARAGTSLKNQESTRNRRRGCHYY